MTLTLQTSLGGDPFLATLSFGDSTQIPSRVIALIGYNGAGKTKFLANLGMIAQADMRQRAKLASEFGEFVGGDPQFAAVIAISYSAFDTFQLPTGQHGHVYCGLRKARISASGRHPSGWALKSIAEISDEFVEAMGKALQRDRRESYEAAVAPLALEPSFAEVGVDELLTLPSEQARERFEMLSTGHKIVLNIVTQLVANLQPNALVLIDEPESHLHPPLLAAMLRAIGSALESFKSFGIVATHSPVVLQEVPRRYVRLLQRYGRRTIVSEPEIETFGENIGILTRHVFNLDASRTDHQGVLRDLAARLSVREIESLFGGGLSSQARAYLVSLNAAE